MRKVREWEGDKTAISHKIALKNVLDWDAYFVTLWKISLAQSWLTRMTYMPHQKNSDFQCLQWNTKSKAQRILGIFFFPNLLQPNISPVASPADQICCSLSQSTSPHILKNLWALKSQWELIIHRYHCSLPSVISHNKRHFKTVKQHPAEHTIHSGLRLSTTPIPTLAGVSVT